MLPVRMSVLLTFTSGSANALAERSRPPPPQPSLSLQPRVILSHITPSCEQNRMWHPGF